MKYEIIKKINQFDSTIELGEFIGKLFPLMDEGETFLDYASRLEDIEDDEDPLAGDFFIDDGIKILEAAEKRWFEIEG